ISGGGRYDYLAEEIGGPATPGVGFGAGIERLLLALEDAGVEAPAEEPIDVLFACDEGAPRERVLALMASLRAAGRTADTDYAGLIFVDLRDQTGICQLVVNPERSAEAAKQAHGIRNEFVLHAEGEVVARAAEAVNPNLPTGEVELQVDTLRVLSSAPPLPFQ